MKDTTKEMFSQEYLDKWYSNYHQLEVYSKQSEDITDGIDKELARWADIQRSIISMLPRELKNMLSCLNPERLSKISLWETMYRQLTCFVQKNGHACLPDDRKHEELQDWLNRQILSRRFLPESQFRKLDSLGIDWNMVLSRDQRWEQMYWRLHDFQKVFGHCRVPQKWPKDKQLALWVMVQRRMHAKSKMREDRERRLQEMGFVWSARDMHDARWEDFFGELAAFYQVHGHCRVPGKQEKLVSWIERQRLSWKKGLLSAERKRRLGEIYFEWSCEAVKAESWGQRYRQLQNFRRKHGHSFVPVNCRENKVLGTWVATQRGLEAKGRLGEAKRKKLDQIGFVWSRETQSRLKSCYDTQWEANFRKLMTYRQEHGACQVSLKKDPELQRWTRWQRRLFQLGRLSAERINRLNEIRFPWSIQEGYWMRMYDVLVEFKRKFGHTRVPSQWKPNPRLAAWVYRIRRDKEELTHQKVELLKEIGFDWTYCPKSVVAWSEMYGRLVKFKQVHGHARVPVKWREDPKLGKWAARMRNERERLSLGRVALLEAIDFYWGGGITPKKRAGAAVGRQIA